MNELEINRTPTVIGAEIRSLTTQAKYLTLWYGIEIGRRLCEAKEMIEHGGWMDFLREETEFSQPSASRFMRLYKEYGSEQGSLFGAESKYSTLNNLSISNALRLLEVPAEERESFAEENDVEHLSSRELEKLLKEKQEELRQAEEGHALAMGELEDQLAEARNAAEEAKQEAREAREAAEPYEKKIRELEEENRELQERPVEVAVQVDEKAVEDAARQAREKEAAEWSGKMAEIQKADGEKALQIEKLENHLEKAQKKLAEAEKMIDEDAGQYKEEVERLKKQLAMSNAEVAVFNIHFYEMQETFGKLMACLEKVRESDPETGRKLEAAMRAVLKQCGDRMGGAA